MNSILKFLSFFLAIWISTGPAVTAVAHETTIGAAGGVQGSVSREETNKSKDSVRSGLSMYENDTVSTKESSRLQVLLKDQTVFTLGPDAEITLDKFVYDDKANAGNVAATVTKGVFRFVTGKVAGEDPANMSIKVPSGTIGIRGTVAMIKADPKTKKTYVALGGPGGRNNANERPGGLKITGEAFAMGALNSVVITRPNWFTAVEAGKVPTPPAPLPPALFHEIYGDLETKPKADSAEAKASLPTPPGSVGAALNTAGETSGDTAAKGAANEILSETSSNQNQNSDKNQTTGVQTCSAHGNTAMCPNSSGAPDGATTWDFIAKNLSGGTGFFFSGHAPTTCQGPCADSSPLGALQLYVDFGNRTFGGGNTITGPSGFTGSFIHVHGVTVSGAGDTIEQKIGNSGNPALAIPFPTSGNALITLNTGVNLAPTTVTSGGSGTFNGSTVQLQNANGIVAGTSSVNFQFVGQNQFTQNVTVTGTFNAPRQ